MGQFVVWDYVVFASVLVISAAVGILFAVTGGKQKTNKEFLLANREMSVVPVAVSMVVTIISAITLVGTPGEMYTYSSEMWFYAIGCSLGYLLAAVFFVPLIFPLKLTSAYEYLELRFDSVAAKLVGTFITLINVILYMAIVMYAPATAMEQVSGAPVWLTMLGIFVVSTFYTALGGMKAVLWVDTLQAVIMIVGVMAVIIQGCIKVGGIDKVFEISAKHGRIEFFDMDPNPLVRNTFWTVVIGGMMDVAARTGVYQASVQRYCSVPTLNKARIATLLNIPFLIIIWSSASLAGLTMFAYYAQKGCDPLEAGLVKNPNQLITYFMIEVLGYPGIPGLFVGSVFSAVLSTTSSIQSAAAAITYEDIIKGRLDRKLSESQKTWLTKGLVVVYGAIGLAVAFVMQKLGGTLIQVGVAFVGASVGPLLGMFVLGAFFPWANWKGAVVGGICGLAFPLFLSFGAYLYWPPTNYLPSPGILNCSMSDAVSNVTAFVTTIVTTAGNVTAAPLEAAVHGTWKDVFTVSYLYNGSIGMATVVVVGLITSLITCPSRKTDVDPKYLIPFFDRLFCNFLPQSCTKKLQCNVDYESVRYDDDDDDDYDEKATNGHIMAYNKDTRM